MFDFASLIFFFAIMFLLYVSAARATRDIQTIARFGPLSFIHFCFVSLSLLLLFCSVAYYCLIVDMSLFIHSLFFFF